MGKTIEQRALEWLLSGATGMSSKTLCAHMLGIEIDFPAPPYDADDRGRCIRLLRLIPEWQDRLDELATHEPVQAIVISARGTEVKSNGWVTQIPLIRNEL